MSDDIWSVPTTDAGSEVQHTHGGPTHTHAGGDAHHAHPDDPRRIPSMVAKRDDPIGVGSKPVERVLGVLPVERVLGVLPVAALQRLDLKPGELLVVHLSPPPPGFADWDAEEVRMVQDAIDWRLEAAGLPNRSLVLFPGVRLEAISPDVVCAVCGNAPRYHPPRAPGQRGAVMDHRFVLARPEDVPHAVEDPRGAPPGLRPDACAQCGAPERLHGQPSRAFGEYLLDHPFVP